MPFQETRTPPRLPSPAAVAPGFQQPPVAAALSFPAYTPRHATRSGAAAPPPPEAPTPFASAPPAAPSSSALPLSLPGTPPPYPLGPPPGSSPNDALHWVIPVGRSWQSVTAGYVALFALVLWPLGLVALTLGIWALVRASRHSGHGRARAVFATLVGLATSALTLLVLGSYLTTAL